MKRLFKKIIVWILTMEARMVLRKHAPKIVAVTGSVGKTSAKDAIFSVLNGFLDVRKNEKSFNSEIGVPLTILGLANAWVSPLGWVRNIILGLKPLFDTAYPKWLVLEVGADHPGDIAAITKWMKPDIAVITRFAEVPVHVEAFDSPEAVYREKMHLAEALPENGLLVYNADDELVAGFCRKIKRRNTTFGFSFDADVRASHAEVDYEDRGDIPVPVGTVFRIDNAGSSVPIRVQGALGAQHVYPALTAAAVALSLEQNMIKIAESLVGHQPPPGRMRVLEGKNGSTLIDDTYNASPVAVAEALKTLASIQTPGKKIAVLADMMELGPYSAAEHKAVGKQAANIADMLVLVGARMRYAGEAAKACGMPEDKIKMFETAVAAADFLEEHLQKGDVALVKGSQSMRMERAVERLLAYPSLASRLLVRQEKEWKGR
jgi:UDP-N-acetylmuramoyl-tripeptide--D-alanyl-D-alanine ligase